MSLFHLALYICGTEPRLSRAADFNQESWREGENKTTVNGHTGDIFWEFSKTPDGWDGKLIVTQVLLT